MWTLIGIGLLGISLAGMTVWAWRGRWPGSTWWIHLYGGRETALGIIPALSLMITSCTAITAAETYAPSIYTTVVWIAAPPLAAGLILVFAGVFHALPAWWGPKWWRDDDITIDEIYPGC